MILSKPISLSALLGVALVLNSGLAEPLKKEPIKSPLSPKEAQKLFQLPPGLRIELVACEPQIESPVAMAFDEHGKLWVVEMRDYPNGPGKGKKPAGRIRVLEDKDGDGFYETSTIFADELLYANGILPWKGGVIVTAAPHIMYLKDTKGTGKADHKEIWYEGFSTQNPQLRVSHPILGLDGWIYCANGLRGGKVIRAGKADAKPVDLSGMDFRFDPLNLDKYEAISGLGQYGNTFDDWGNRFVCDNRHHLRHIVIENRYLKRNPNLAAPAVVEDISVLDDGPLNSGGKIYPISSNWTTSNLHEGRFTAACSVFIYRGMPPPFRKAKASPLLPWGAAFTCDPTGNLVHMEVLEPKGATFQARPVYKDKEFLASPDDWFRPVFLSSGPGAAIYIVDMYRAVIEHPDFMPPELKNRPDLTLGKDKGRIWRIVKDTPKKGTGPWPATGNVERKLQNLDDLHPWWRTTAHRLLLEHNDPQSIDLMRQRLQRLKPAGRVTEVRAVNLAWLLKAHGALKEDDLLDLLGRKSPRLVENAILIAEASLRKSAKIQDHFLTLAKHEDPRVRFQIALSLGEWDDAKIVEPLVHIAMVGADDKWTRLAVASSLNKRAAEFMKALFKDEKFTTDVTPGRLALVKEIAALLGLPESAGALLDPLMKLQGPHSKHWQMACLEGLPARTFFNFHALAYMGNDNWVPTVRKITALLDECSAAAANAKLAVSERLDCIRLLRLHHWSGTSAALLPLLAGDHSQEIRLACARTLSSFGVNGVAEALMKNWKSYTPAVRREVTEAMFRDPSRLDYLLKEIEAKRVRPADIDALRTRQLVNHKNADIQKRARKLLADNIPADRKDVLARYQKALELKGDAKNGRTIFQKNCATCHRVAGIGTDVGPDISDTRTKTPTGLLIDILNPNQAIDNNYVNYIVLKKDGTTLSGIITAETASSISLKRAEGQGDVVLRKDIDEIQSSGVSLMPDGLEKTINMQEMADLLSFLKNWRYLDGKTPIGQ